jgi:hypothetical protein
VSVVCGRFQALHLTCSHVIVACSSDRQNYQVYISEVYQVSTVFNVYNEPFEVIRNEVFLPSFQSIKLYVNEEIRTTKKGRPSSTRIRIEIDDFTKQPNVGYMDNPIIIVPTVHKC